MRKVLVTIQYEVDGAKRDAYLDHARAMREHAVETLGLDYDVFEDFAQANLFTEVFRCDSIEEYEALDEKQDDAFRELIARLDRFTDLSLVRYSAAGHLF